MDMGYSSEQIAIRDSIRKFLRAENPIAVAREATQNSAGYAVDVWRKIAELGWPGIGIPEQYGGGGLGLQELALMYEEFGRALYQGPHFGGAFLCGQLVLKLGSENQKQELLPAMASGRSIMSLALLEENARWDEPGINLRAQRTRDGWCLTGTKLFVTHATAAHELLCAARDVETGGISLFRLRDPKALSISLMPSTFGALYHEVTLRDVPVARDDIVGAPGKSWPAIQQVREWGAAVQCAEMVGLAQSILDMSVEYAKVRVQFGRPIGTYQAMQHVLADMVTRLDCARLLTYQAVSLLADGRPSQRALGMAKAYVNEGAYQIALDGMQVHGGMGYMMEHPLPYYVQRILYGKMNLGDTDAYLEEVAQALGL
ncbi:MAG: acyl-CoA/acyl-ACP dehydrogenase [Betaproteobacteria bacterium]|nr:acyl-CoA/acyl-ACP dehydrogenase [Betaproteobacteria bacterium]MBI3052728.1 acyl-CoA/acyl-ACP dehydrogenase [Betaproteobacteria bacterium]